VIVVVHYFIIARGAGHLAGREVVSQADVSADDRAGANLDAGHDVGINTRLAVTADDGPELVETGIYRLTFYLNGDIPFIEAEVAEHGAGAEGAAAADDGVAGVAHMKPAVVPDVGSLDLGGETDNAASPDVAVLADKAAVADNGAGADIDRPPDDRILEDPDIIRDNHLAFDGGLTGNTGRGGDVSLAPVEEAPHGGEDVPGVLDGVPGAGVGNDPDVTGVPGDGTEGTLIDIIPAGADISDIFKEPLRVAVQVDKDIYQVGGFITPARLLHNTL